MSAPPSDLRPSHRSIIDHPCRAARADRRHRDGRPLRQREHHTERRGNRSEQACSTDERRGTRKQGYALNSDGEVGAGDGSRTRDLLLGKQTLCRLSYSRSGGGDRKPSAAPSPARAGPDRGNSKSVPRTPDPEVSAHQPRAAMHVGRQVRAESGDRGEKAAAQIEAFTDTWEWNTEAAAAYQEVVEQGGEVAKAMIALPHPARARATCWRTCR